LDDLPVDPILDDLRSKLDELHVAELLLVVLRSPFRAHKYCRLPLGPLTQDLVNITKKGDAFFKFQATTVGILGTDHTTRSHLLLGR
jgi:hypothetical protein